MTCSITFASVAEQTHVLEVRRTFSSPHCDTGELYVDGQLRGMFLTASEVIPNLIKITPIIDTKVSSHYTILAGVYGRPEKHNGLRFTNGTSGNLVLDAALLDSDNYSDFSSRRTKTRALKPVDLVVGSTVENRLCTVSAPGISPYFEGHEIYPSATDLFARSLFDTKLSKENFVDGVARNVLLVLSDKSAGFEVAFGSLKFRLTTPVRVADSISDSDKCLTSFENLGNRWTQSNTTSYRRKDGIWVCTNGELQGELSGQGLEIRRQVGFIEIWSNGPACTTVLGLPLQTIYLIMRKQDGRGAAAFTRCAADEAWKKISDSVDIH